MVDLKRSFSGMCWFVLSAIKSILFVASILCASAVLVITGAGIYAGVILVPQPDQICIALVIGFFIFMLGFDRLDEKMRLKA